MVCFNTEAGVEQRIDPFFLDVASFHEAEELYAGWCDSPQLENHWRTRCLPVGQCQADALENWIRRHWLQTCRRGLRDHRWLYGCVESPSIHQSPTESSSSSSHCRTSLSSESKSHNALLQQQLEVSRSPPEPIKSGLDPGRRIDPENGQVYSFDGLLKKYIWQWSLRRIRDHWEMCCRPEASQSFQCSCEPLRSSLSVKPVHAASGQQAKPSYQPSTISHPGSGGLQTSAQRASPSRPGRAKTMVASHKASPSYGVSCPAEFDDELEKLALQVQASWPNDGARVLDVAESLKQKGNALFKKHNYGEACDQYSRALSLLASAQELPPDCSVALLTSQLLNNRAACSHQVHEWDAVVVDTSEALDLDPGNFKALLRRAIAYESLGQADFAFADATIVLRGEPGHPSAMGIRNRTRNLAEEAARTRSQIKKAASPADAPASNEEALMTFRMDDVDILARGFPWSANCFEEGDVKNLKLLAEIEKEFERKVYTTPPHWWGLDQAIEDPECLRAALDYALACIKNYELDRSDAVFRYVLPACRARGLPWNVKGLQDCATLRMKQNRQAEAAVLLEEINHFVPPHPIHWKNLGTCYNSLRQHRKALEHFEQAVALKDGWMDPSDRWDIGLAKKNLKEFDEGIGLLQAALEGFRAEGVDPVTLAKLHDSIGGCYMEMGEHLRKEAQYARWAEPHFREAESLFKQSVGATSPLYQSAARCISRSLFTQRRLHEAEPWLREALRVESIKNGVHPTPLHEMTEELLSLAAAGGIPDFSAYHELLQAALDNLVRHGLANDGNGGMVMHKTGRFFMASGSRYRPAALHHLLKALELISEHEEPEVDTSWTCAIIELEIVHCRKLMESELLCICDGVC